MMPECGGSTHSESSESSDSLRSPGIFDGLTAWFSTSVDQHYIQQWEEEDGQVTEMDTALFIFSEDATSPDTEAIYESQEYLYDCLAVFHPTFITECVHKGDAKQVVTGKYFMPPMEVQKAMRRSKFPWNFKGKSALLVKTPQKLMNRVKPSHNLKYTSVRSVSNRASKSLARAVQPRPKYTAQSPTRARAASVSQHHSLTNKSTKSNNKKGQSLPVFKLDAYIPVEMLCAYSGQLEDFVVGQNDCSVVKKSR